MTEITVIKMNVAGLETFRYHGNVLHRDETSLILEANFQLKDLDYHGMPLLKGDRFIETYYTDRWYNVYEIHARGDDHLRGWYCNITYPAVIDNDVVSYVDLALDLLVFPNGRQLVLDEAEFIELALPMEAVFQARQALDELQNSFRNKLAGNTGKQRFS